MAILKQLLVHGSSRFLNTIYANDLNVDGTTAFTDLTVTGTTNLAAGSANSASLQINSKGALYGYDAWLRINQQKHFSSGVYFGTNVVRTDGSFQVGSNGANILMNTSAATFKVPINMNGTTYKWDTSGNIVVKKITASSGLVDDLIVTNELRTFKWDIQHIANLGGSFLVTPTLNCTANSATFTVTAISGNTITAAIKDSTAITGNSLGGTTWPADSKIKISGKIGGIVLGTCDGKLTAAMNNTAGTLNIQFTYPDQATNPLAVQTYNAANVSNLTVMLTTVGATNPIGIYMTSYDTNGFSHISLYGGTATAPTVRIGNLQGLAAINNVTPTGWGIYTNNGFFSGTVVSESGKIGGYTLDSTSLFSGTKGNSTTSGHFTLTTGTFSRAIDGTTRSNLQMALGAKFGVANDGTLYTNGANITNINASNIKTGTLSADRIAANSIQASKLSISDLQAIGATIGGFDVDSTSIHTNDVAVTSNADNSIALSSSDFTRTINGTSRAGLRFAIGDKFGVTGDGAIYASSATISGAITATSGTIGGWTANSSYGLYTNGKTSATSTKTGVLIQKDGAIYAGAYDSTKTACPFQVTSAGALTATSATITGEITATSGTIGGCAIDANGNLQVPAANITGKLTASQINVSDLNALNATIGGFTIGNTAIYNGKTSYSQTTNNGVWLGTDGIGLGKGAFYVTNAGSVYAKSGTIGGWTLSANSLTTGTWGNSNSAMLCTGTSTAKSIGGSASISDWVFTAGANFGVTKAGAIYANDVHLSGEITATSGTIGGCSIDTNGVLQVPAANITGQLTASQIDASGITIGQSQVTNLSTALGNKADATTVTALQNKVIAVYGTSTTAAATQIKDITCENFTLFTGARIVVKFTKANTAASPKIKFNGQDDTDACAIWVNNAGASTSNPILWTANTVLTFTYDGSVWVLENKPSTYNVNSNTTATAQSKTTTTPNGILVLDGTIAVVSFSQSNTYASNYLQLNFAGTGNAKIYLDSGVTSATNTLLWNANTILTFTRDGGLWRLTNRSDASKTATKYIVADSTGLMVADMSGGAATSSTVTARNVFIDSSSINIRNGTTTLAKFGAETIIGQSNSNSSNVFIDSDSVDIRNGTTVKASFGTETRIGQSNNNNVFIDSDSVDIRNGTTVKASFGSTIILGKTNSMYTQISNKNFKIFTDSNYGSNNQKELLYTGVINNDNGIAEIVEKYYITEYWSDGTAFFFNHPCLNVINATAGGSNIPTSNYSYDDGCFYIVSSAQSTYRGKIISVRYTTDDYIPIFNYGLNSCTSLLATSFGESNSVCGNYAFSAGNNNLSGNIHTFTFGKECNALQPFAYATGLGTFAGGYNQTVIGRYNAIDAYSDESISDSNFAFIIGNGSSDSDRSNAFAVTWDGTPRGSKIQHNVNSTFELTNYPLHGMVTTNTVYLELTTEKFLDTVSTITVNTLTGGLRGVLGYLDGTTYNTNWKGSSAYTITAEKKSRRHIVITIAKKSGNFTNITQNTPVSFFATLKLTFT